MLDNVLSDVVWRRRWYHFNRIHHSNSLMIDASHALTRYTLNCGIGLGFSAGGYLLRRRAVLSPFLRREIHLP